MARPAQSEGTKDVRADRYHPALASRGSSWRILWPFAVVVALGIVWTGLWYYAAHIAEQTLAGWRAREAVASRIHTCKSQTIGGFPFRIEMRCIEPVVEIRSLQPPLTIRGLDIVIVAQVWDPTLLISEIAGPVNVSESGAQTTTATWTLAQASLRGLPTAPERVSLVFDKPAFTRAANGGTETILKAEHLELHGRLASGSAAANPAIDIAINLVKTTAPALSPYAAKPVDADITGTLHGLNDLTAKSWPQRFKDLQAGNGRFEITKMRIAQGDVVAAAIGALKLSARGRLDGELRVTVANVEQAIAALGLDRLLAQATGNQATAGNSGRLSQFAPALGNLEKQVPGLANSLERLAPGLGGLVRGQPEGIAALVRTLGTPAELEGKRAVTLTVRFSDGRASLGPIPLGEVPPLF